MSEENFNAGNADLDNIKVTTGNGEPEDELGSTAYERKQDPAAPTPGEPDADGII